MTVELLTGNSLANELGVPGIRITRAVRRHIISPDYLAGRTMLFRPSRLPNLRAAISAPIKPL